MDHASPPPLFSRAYGHKRSGVPFAHTMYPAFLTLASLVLRSCSYKVVDTSSSDPSLASVLAPAKLTQLEEDARAVNRLKMLTKKVQAKQRRRTERKTILEKSRHTALTDVKEGGGTREEIPPNANSIAQLAAAALQSVTGPPATDETDKTTRPARTKTISFNPLTPLGTTATPPRGRVASRGSSTFRVRHSVLTTDRQTKEMTAKKLKRMLKDETLDEEPRAGPAHATTTATTTTNTSRHENTSTEESLGRVSPPPAPLITSLLTELSTQPDAPLHFNMELTLQSGNPAASEASESSEFLAFLHPHGTPAILPCGQIRAGAGEFRGGTTPTIEAGPTDVAVVKVVDLKEQGNGRAVR